MQKLNVILPYQWTDWEIAILILHFFYESYYSFPSLKILSAALLIHSHLTKAQLQSYIFFNTCTSSLLSSDFSPRAHRCESSRSHWYTIHLKSQSIPSLSCSSLTEFYFLLPSSFVCFFFTLTHPILWYNVTVLWVRSQHFTGTPWDWPSKNT